MSGGRLRLRGCAQLCGKPAARAVYENKTTSDIWPRPWAGARGDVDAMHYAGKDSPRRSSVSLSQSTRGTST
jgi:hypothetical protein